jgi:hypothetical protein
MPMILVVCVVVPGDLSSPVAIYPPIPGNSEAHLLRAAIADITAETVLSLAGVVEPDDDAFAEEPPLVKVSRRRCCCCMKGSGGGCKTQG